VHAIGTVEVAQPVAVAIPLREVREERRQVFRDRRLFLGHRVRPIDHEEEGQGRPSHGRGPMLDDRLADGRRRVCATSRQTPEQDRRAPSER